MKNIIAIGFLLLSAITFSQNQSSISGTTTDKEMNNGPLLFANIHIKNTSFQTQTNLHGNFKINNINAGEYTLVINYLGYETVEIPVVVKENSSTKISSCVAAIHISPDDIEGLVTVSKKNDAITSDIEKSLD